MKQLEQEDLTLLNNLQKANNDLITELGQIGLIEINLKKRKESANEYLAKLREKEALISKSLEEKYGKGTVDMDNGTFIPIK